MWLIGLATAVLRSSALPSLEHYDLYHECRWTTRGHRWAFRVYWSKSGDLANNDLDPELEKLNLVLLDGKVVMRLANEKDRPDWEPWGTYLAAETVKVASPYERVVAIRGAGGLGTHWDTRFYGFDRGRMTYIGGAPSLNANGPLNWRGNRSLWLFDDYDRYEAMNGKGVTSHKVFRVVKGQTMSRVASWPSHRKLRRVVQLKELE